MPKINNVEAVFDPATEEYTLVFTGEEIDGHYSTESDVEVFIGGDAQTVTSVSDTEMVV
jgi:hypothetical protein